MGDIVEMILEGILCEKCGEFIDIFTAGYPRTCENCEEKEREI